MPGISIHVVDVSRGLVATGMRVELRSIAGAGSLISTGIISGKGLLESAELDRVFAPGTYEARFYIAEYYRQAGVALPAVPFLDVVDYRFGVSDSAQHHHLPFKMTPWGYSCFRGGA